MASDRTEAEKDEPKSLAERFMAHARGPMGLASIGREIGYAITDIRHKWEEAAYGRAVTPRWDSHQATPEAGGIHGKAETPPSVPGGDGGVHGKADVEPKPDAPGPTETVTAGAKMPSEAKGLGMSFAELSQSWDRTYGPSQDAGHEREQSREQDHGIDR
jgi:hypothetical protein